MLIPLRAVIEHPSREQTADSYGEIEADDGFRYHVKADQPGRFLCASEWICTNIAEEIGISVPTPKAIELFDGRRVFGSRRISGVADKVITRLFLLTQTRFDMVSQEPELCSVLSKIYAWDLFINNMDRHLDNYLSVEDSGKRRLYEMDNSRALFFQWPFDGFPPTSQHTRTCGKILRDLHGFDLEAALIVLERLHRLAPAIIEGFISRMPPEWISPELRREFMDWWSNGGRTRRLVDLDAGLRNGGLL